MTVLTTANAFPGMPFPQHGNNAQFDPAKIGTHIVLSNRNLQIDRAGNFAVYNYALSVVGASAGKFYFEVTTNIDGATGTYNIGVGFGVAGSATETAGIGNNGTDNAGWWCDASDVNLYQNGNVGTSIGISSAGANGNVIGMALDLGNKRIWYRLNGGNWNGNVANNPATNTGGVDVSPSLSGSPTVYALVTFQLSNASTITANFGQTAYSNAAPAGFGNWGSTIFTNTVQSYLYPGAVLPFPNPPPPSVLSFTNAFPNLAFPQSIYVQGLDAATTAWVSAVKSAGSFVSIGRQILVNNLITGLKSNGLFTLLDRLWLFAAETSAQSRLDVIAAATAGESGGAFVANQGWGVGNVTSDIGATTGGILFSQNSAQVSTWLFTGNASPSGAAVMSQSVATPGGDNHYLPFSDGQIYMRLNGVTNSPSIVAYPGTGLYTSNRSGVSAVQYYRNGASIGSSSETSSAPLAGTWQWAGYTGGMISIGAIGSSMTSGQVATFYTLLNTYMTAIAATPPSDSAAVRSFLYPGAVQPIVFVPVTGPFMIFSQQKIIIPLLMTVPVSVTLHNP